MVNEKKNEKLTADEAAVYDRQLRVWGLETQQKLRSSKVLIVGCTGVAAEIAKNIVLAGVGAVILVDDTPCTSAAPGNFLVTHDAEQKTVAEACVATLQEMNPLVSVSSVPGTSDHHLPADALTGCNIVILAGQNGFIVNDADKACKKANIPFISACTRGPVGWAFSNLQAHDYIIENKVEDKEGGRATTTQERHHVDGVAWVDALQAKVEKRNVKRMSSLLPILRACSRFELKSGRAVQPSDVDALKTAVEELRNEEGLMKGSEVDDWALAAFVQHPQEMPAINAIVGGVVANDVIKITASKGEPIINNLFLYSLVDGGGWVEKVGG